MSLSMNDKAKKLRQGTVGGIALAVALALAGAAVLPGAAQAAAEKEQKISSTIGKEMKAAQEALQKGQFQEALKNLDAASQKSGLTTFDKFKIYDYKGYADVKLQHYKEAQADIEAALATGQYTSEEASKQTKVVFQLAAQNQQYGKAVEYGKQLADQGALAPNDYIIVAQLYYVQKDCKNSSVWADKAVAAYKKAGETPKETPYQFKLQCASDAGDMASMESPLIELIKLTNKTAYWNDLLRIERQDERDDHNLLMIYRVMYNTQSMKEGSDYIEMAQLLGDAGLSGEAAAVLNKAAGCPTAPQGNAAGS
jgi:tetratricopeptide (TPR) repeat protein